MQNISWAEPEVLNDKMGRSDLKQIYFENHSSSSCDTVINKRAAATLLPCDFELLLFLKWTWAQVVHDVDVHLNQMDSWARTATGRTLWGYVTVAWSQLIAWAADGTPHEVNSYESPI